MVLINRRNSLKGRITSKSKIFATIIAGVTLIILPILAKIVDPIQMILNYKLRLAKGSMLYEILQQEFVAGRLSLYMFNITNAERFLSGEDYKIKVEEVGPFVFQEYRWYEDMVVSEDGKEMTMTPKIRQEFVPEESIADPKDINLSVPNLPFLTATALISKCPAFLRYTYNILAAQLGCKPIINIDVHKFLWGYEDPLMSVVNGLFPGLVHFSKLGLLDRLYDPVADYKVTVGATDKDKFKIKSVKKFRLISTDSINDVAETEQTFAEDSYEGVGYPPLLTPDIPLNLYRLGICKPFNMKYNGVRHMGYGGDGLVYTFSNKTFTGSFSPITNDPYPEGLMDISKCYYDLPFAVSRGHLLDADPKISERIEGLHPDRKEHLNEIVIDYKVSVPYLTNMSLQLNIILEDVSYNSETKMISNSVIPFLHLKVDQPTMPEHIQFKFDLFYHVVPKVMLAITVAQALTGLLLLSRALLLMYRNWVASSSSKSMVFEATLNRKLIYSNAPVLMQ